MRKHWPAHSKNANVIEDKETKKLFLFKGHHRRTIQKKSLNDPDYCDDMIIHLDPDILECEVKWTLGSITVNKTSGGDRIPAELFQILKDDAVKMLHSICQQI